MRINISRRFVDLYVFDGSGITTICRDLSVGTNSFLPFLSQCFSMTFVSLILSLIRERGIPCLPPKSYFSRFNKEVIDSRQEGLQDFLKE